MTFRIRGAGALTDKGSIRETYLLGTGRVGGGVVFFSYNLPNLPKSLVREVGTDRQVVSGEVYGEIFL